MRAAEVIGPLSEKDFLRQVCELATIRGWLYLHIRAARTADSWRTPISGPLGKGWPDLVLVRESQSGPRLLFVELKAEGGKVTPDQSRVLDTLRMVESSSEGLVEVHVWHPSDWRLVEQVLR